MIRARGVEAELGGPRLAHHDRGGRAVVERARVAGGDGPVLPERGRQGPELLERGGRARPVVLRDLRAVHAHRDDLAIEDPGLLRGHRTLLGALGVLVLLLTRDAVALRDVLGGQAHRDERVRTAVVSLQPLVLVLGAGCLLRAVVARDELDARGDIGVALPGRDVVRCDADRVEARGAIARDGRARGLLAQLVAQQHRDAGDVVRLQALRLAAAGDHLLDARGVDIRVALQDLVDDVRQGLVRPQ